MFPKIGKTFQNHGNGSFSQPEYAGAIRGALQREVGGTRHATKTLMNWTGANERTVRNWLAGTRGPSGTHLVLLIRKSDKVLEALLTASERRPYLAAAAVVESTNKMAEEMRRLRSMLADFALDSNFWPRQRG
jgi:hypothetical protein